MAFLIDGSASIQTLNLSAALQYKNLVKTVIDFYKVDKDDTNVGLVVYSSLTITQFTFDTYYSKTDINEAIDTMSYPENATYTGAGLEAVQNNLFGHARPGMHNCLVAVTDGMSNDDVSLPAAHLKAMKVVTLAVGVGEFYSTDELQQIATTPSHVFQAPVYDDLHDTADKIKESLCNGKNEITEQFGVCFNKAESLNNYGGLESCPLSSTATCLYIERTLGTRDWRKGKKSPKCLASIFFFLSPLRHLLFSQKKFLTKKGKICRSYILRYSDGGEQTLSDHCCL